jgi:hypothetical protein
MSNFTPRDNPGKSVWLKNFAIKLPLYAAKYNITPNEVNDIVQSSHFFSYVIEYQRQIDEYKTNLTAYRDELRDGVQQFGILQDLPTLPPFAAAPPTAANGIFKRVMAIAQRIKKSTQYAEADGRDLGIILEQATLEPQKAKPTFHIRLIAGGHPEIVWQKGKMDGVEIWVKRHAADPDFVFLAYDQRPNYTDMHPLPTSGGAAVWQYKLIYRYKDQPAGAWSDVVSVIVG